MEEHLSVAASTNNNTHLENRQGSLDSPVKDGIESAFVDEPINGSASSPSLVKHGQSGTGRVPWTRKQKRTYRQLLSWMTLKTGEGCQLLRVDLTSVEGGGAKLTENFKRLRRMVERQFSYDVQYFKIETTEGNGVLHMVWAINCPSAVWIPQKWLSRTWEALTGANRVWICRLGASRHPRTGRRLKKRDIGEHIKSVARYMASQYLALQEALKRISWSWWRSSIAIGKAYTEFNKKIRIGYYVQGYGLKHDMISRSEALSGWSELLRFGWTMVDMRRAFYIEDREIKVRQCEVSI